ncbi:hypothetical protein [Caulobacter sp.]|uniref:hypothetical protein n=1 Tax=Caulobacter sp. TaxID=78 RepID=UPI003BA92DF6
MPVFKMPTRAQAAFGAVATLVPLLLFGFMFGFDLPLAKAAFWSLPKNDMMIMTAAYEAFVRQPWTVPIAMVSGLTPTPVSIVFADSIPWLAVALKALGVGPYFNPLGLFLLLSYPLQVWGMISLLRALGVKQAAPLLIGGLMALLFPAWIARQFGHIALSGHWIILFALALTITSTRLGLTARRIAGFALIAGLATGIHAYHLVPVGACFGAALLSELMQRRPGAWRRVAIAAVAVATTVALSALVLGYTQGSGDVGGADAIGFYSMNALGPVWPQASRVFGQLWTGVWYKGVLDPNGGQYFEGFQYLGTGTLVLVLVMLGLLARDFARGVRPEAGFWSRWSPLIAAMVVLTLWAIGWVIYAGPVLVGKLPKPSGAIANIIGGFRCHGRFFWAPGYLIMALAITWVSRLEGRKGVLLLAAAALLQVYDSSPLRQGVRHIFAAPDRFDFPIALAQSPAVRGRAWVFRPTYFCSPNGLDQRVISQMDMLVVRTGGTTNTFPTARSNDGACELVPAEITRDAAPGDRRLSVVLSNGQMEGGPLKPVANRTDCYRFRRGVICGRDLAGIDGLAPVLPGELIAERAPVWVARMDQPVRPAALVSGWATLDPGGKGVWSIAREAWLQVEVPRVIKPNGLFVEITAIGFSDEPIRPQRVIPSINGRRLAPFQVDPGNFYNYRFKVPADLLKAGKPVRIKLDLPDARNSTGDPRILGIGLQQVRVLD